MRNSLLATLLVSSTALAQSEWIVDEKNGPGTHFLDVPPALAAAVDGDSIYVRPGTYNGGSTSKALSVVGEVGANFNGVFEVKWLPRDKTFCIVGFGSAKGGWTLRLERNEGRVHVHGLRVEAPRGIDAALHIEDCYHVTILNGDYRGQPAVLCDASWVTISDTSMRGYAGGPECWPRGHEGLVVSGDSDLTIAAVKIYGGDTTSLTEPSAPAVRLTGDSKLLVIGDKNTLLIAGNNKAPVGTPAVETLDTASSMIVDPNVTLVPNKGAPDIGGPALVTRRRHPSMKTTVNLAGDIKVDVFSKAGDFCFLLGMRAGNQIKSPFGTFWLDAKRPHLLAIGVVGGNQHWVMNVPLPEGLPAGLPIGLQSLVGAPTTLELTNPGVVILH